MRTIYLPLFLILNSLVGYGQLNQNLNSESQSQIIVVKFKDSQNSNTATRTQSIQDRLTKITGVNLQSAQVEQPFAKHFYAKKGNTVQRQASSSLEQIFKVKIDGPVAVAPIIKSLNSRNDVAYAELLPEPQLLEGIADEKLASQHYIEIINAAQAWEMQSGSGDMVIGILDTGTDLNHPDLAANLYVNTGEIPNNNIDDDQDGFVDNYHGWDFANNDSDPTADKHSHGVGVSGVAAAVRNNGGISGLSNNCKFMPIKVFSSSSNKFINGYEAIVYAADKGCQVINLSWGAPGSYSQYIQDIINYAVLEKDAVVVAAAGNTNAELDFYPASTQHVLSVSSIEGNGKENTNEKASWATYSRFVDLVAPGVNILTTNTKGGYLHNSGTSFSTPMVSATAALVRLKYPELSAIQVMELIRQSVKGFGATDTGHPFSYRLGKGSLNMEAALNGITGPSVRVSSFAFTNGIGKFVYRDDTISVDLDFTNYLAAATGLKVSVISESPYATIISDPISINSLKTLENRQLQNSVKLVISPDLPPSQPITLRLEFNADGYTDYQYIELPGSDEYMNVSVNDYELTISGNGNLGYNYDFNLQGIGLTYQDKALAQNFGLLVGAESGIVANNIVKTTKPVRRDQDFTLARSLKVYENNSERVDVRSAFTTNASTETPLNLMFEQQLIGWNKDELNSTYVMEYRVFNNSDSTYNNLNVALYADFDLNNQNSNKAAWLADEKLGYTYDETTNTFAGIVLLTQQDAIYYALDLGDENGNVAEVGPKFSREQKHKFISSGVAKTTAGNLGAGNNVAQINGAILRELLPNQEQRVALGMVMANSLESLKTKSAKLARQYAAYLVESPTMASIQLCEPVQDYALNLAKNNAYRIVSDAVASQVIYEGSELSVDVNRDTVIYVQQYNGLYYNEPQAITFTISTAQASFEFTNTTIQLENGVATVAINNTSANIAESNWQLNNGTTIAEHSPVYTFTEAGTYQLSLTTTNTNGCQATVTKSITVLEEKFAQTVVAYPNPVQDCLTVALPEEAIGQASIILTDLNGRILARKYSVGADKEIKIATQNLEPGCYVLYVSTLAKSWHHKIVKN